MKILVGCEYSQVATKALRERGHEAYSCDVLPTIGNPEWHFQCDVFEAVAKENWDMGLFFPPCTHLAVSGSRSFAEKRADGRQQEGIEFFMKCINANIEKIAVENPVGIMSTLYRKPDQIVHPYYFGDTIPKKTCLWLKNLPTLTWKAENMSEPEYVIYNSKKNKSGKSKYSVLGKLGSGKGHERSALSPFLANAMAEQWG